jgi:hypothetical protein
MILRALRDLRTFAMVFLESARRAGERRAGERHVKATTGTHAPRSDVQVLDLGVRSSAPLPKLILRALRDLRTFAMIFLESARSRPRAPSEQSSIYRSLRDCVDGFGRLFAITSRVRD